MEWREREHESQDSVALDDPTTMQALRNCGLYKYWIILWDERLGRAYDLVGHGMSRTNAL